MFSPFGSNDASTTRYVFRGWNRLSILLGKKRDVKWLTGRGFSLEGSSD
jgi:hypothetical protein